MKHFTEELIHVVHHYYPRGRFVDVPGFRGLPPDASPPAGYDTTEEARRLVRTIVEAGKNRYTWLHVLKQIRARFPELIVDDHSLHLLDPAGDGHRCYAGSMLLPPRGPMEEHHRLHFMASFLAPYYVIYASSWTLPPQQEYEYHFELSPDEQPYAQVVASILEACFPGFDFMPPGIGSIKLPDVVTHFQCLGEATLYQCLFMNCW